MLVWALPRDPHVETKAVSPRDDIISKFLLLSLRFTLSQLNFLQLILFCLLVKKTFDLEGWAVGEAVAVNKSYIVSKSVGVSYEIRLIFFFTTFHLKQFG